MNKEKKIPTLLGIFLLLAGTVAGITLTGGPRIYNSKASNSCIPQNVQITNQTHSAFDLSFLTDSDCRLDLLIDNRTITDHRDNSKVHYFQISNLKEDTLYSYSLIGNGQKFENKTYQVQTGKKPQSPLPTSNLAWGKVFDSNHLPATNAVVYLNIPGALPLSALVTSSGNWSISLASCFNESKNDWFIPPSDTPEDLIVISADGSQSQVSGNTRNNNPVPDIILGKNSFSSISEPDSFSLGELSTANSTSTLSSLQIISPKEGETIHTATPDIFGKAAPNSTITVDLSPLYSQAENAFVDSQGVWHHSPTTPLSPGSYSITITASDVSTGQPLTVKRSFTVAKGSTTLLENQPLAFTASASATRVPTPPASITPSPSPLPSPSLAPTITPRPSSPSSPTPTRLVTATLTPTRLPTLIPTTRTAKPSVSTPPPETGGVVPTAALLAMSIIFVGTGIFFISKYH
jgi:hypothetical protein